jgi:hypothetical protein
MDSTFLNTHFVSLHVPEHEGQLRLLSLRVRVDARVSKVAPLVVGANVGEENVRIYRQGDPQRTAFPAATGERFSGHFQCP